MRRYIDDVYVDYTFSRVLLGAVSTGWEDCTILEPQIPSAWATGEIAATVNLGALTGETAYLYVFDSANAVNATGYEVTLDAEEPPAYPTSFTGGVITGGSVQ